MGIKSLSEFLQNNHKDLFECIHISEYQFKKVAIDTSLYLCNYKAVYGEEGWLAAFVRLVAILRQNEIHCVFVYDSGAPAEKAAERKRREESREKSLDRIADLEDALEDLKNNGIVSDILIEFQKKRKIAPLKSLIGNKGGATINISAIEYAIAKMRKNMFVIKKEDFETTKELFRILDVPFIDAPLEAETTCADLCLQGKVDAVLSEDTDVLAYHAPVFLTKFDVKTGTCMRLKYDEVIAAMELDSDSFLDFCIMCGTDYNKNIFGIGPAKAYKLISTHKSIDNLPASLDISPLNHVRTREIFRGYKKYKGKISYCGIPNFNELQIFVVKKNLNLSIEHLRKCFVKEITVIED